MIQQLKNRNRAKDPHFRAPIWMLTRAMFKELVRLGKDRSGTVSLMQSPLQGIHLEDEPRHTDPGPGPGSVGNDDAVVARQKILRQACRGAKSLNIMDVCQCLQGLAAVNLRCGVWVGMICTYGYTYSRIGGTHNDT